MELGVKAKAVPDQHCAELIWQSLVQLVLPSPLFFSPPPPSGPGTPGFNQDLLGTMGDDFYIFPSSGGMHVRRSDLHVYISSFGLYGSFAGIDLRWGGVLCS